MTATTLIQVEPGNSGPTNIGAVTVVWPGDTSQVEAKPYRTIIDGASHPGVAVGWLYDGTSFTAPPGWVAPPAPAPAPTTTVMKAVLWYNCFTPTEAVAIRKSSDPLVQEFVYRLNQLIAAGENVDTALASVQEGVGYLSVTDQVPAVTPAAPYIAPARVAAILAGVLQ